MDAEEFEPDVKDALEKAGVVVAQTKSGNEAIDFLYEKQLPDLIFVNLDSTVEGGHEFLAEIRRNILFRGIPVMVLSPEKPVSAGDVLEKLAKLNVLRDD